MDACISKLHREWPIPTGGEEDWTGIVGVHPHLDYP